MEGLLKKNEFVLIVLLLLFMRTSSASSSSEIFIKVFFPNGLTLTAELAITDVERALGLMFRDTIEWDQAMLFLFEKEDFHSFWMKNVKFPLDFIWLDKDKRIVHIETGVPPCKEVDCPSYSPRYPAMYFLEAKSGCVRKNQLKLYDKIDFVLPKSKKEKKRGRSQGGRPILSQNQ